MVSDFNAVRHMEERRVNIELGHSNNREIIEFNVFINSMELQDIPILESLFIWYKVRVKQKVALIDSLYHRGGCVSDRYLLNLLGKDISLTIVLSESEILLDRIRGQSLWFLELGFCKWAGDEYKKLSIQGWGVHVLKEKSKTMKRKLKEWHKEHFGNLTFERAKAVNKINTLDGKDNLGSITLSEAQIRKDEDEIKKAWDLARKHEALLFQKSKI